MSLGAVEGAGCPVAQVEWDHRAAGLGTARPVVCWRWERPRSAASLVASLVLASNLVLAAPAAAATVPTGFTDSIVASGMPNPTAMAFAPDGRLFVAQQGGALRVIKNGSLLATPFLTVTVNSSGERGLLGVAFDPDFTINQYVYVYYTATTPAIHNRVSRFTANGDVVVPGSEIVILELPNLSAHESQRGCDPLRARRQALHRRRRECRFVQLPNPGQSPREDAADQPRRLDPDRQPVLRHRPAASAGRSGRWAFGIRSRSRSSRARVGCSSTTWGRARGKRSTTASRARTTAGRSLKVRRAHQGIAGPSLPMATAMPQLTGARSPAAPSTTPSPPSSRRPTSGATSSPTLRRRDPSDRTGQRLCVQHLRDGDRLAGRPAGWT